MADLIPMLAAVAGQAGEEADEDFNQTVLLLHGDGTNGAQNNTFLDGSTNNFTITRNGNTTQGTFSPFSGADGYWSNFFDGTNDRLTIADNAALRPGTSNFTIEAWVYRAAAGAAHTIFAKGASTPTGFAFLITSSDTLRFTDTSTDITSTGTVAANTWVHVAAVREGTGSNQLKLYINGVQDGTGTSSSDFTQTEEARIGENRGATDDFNGYISNFRYVIGTALYTAGFTPSTSPLTTTSQGATSSEVELLTCQSNRFLDNSTNAFTVSPVNNVRVTPFSPFAPSAAYDPAVNGGSGYFDGSGDYLTTANDAALNFGTGDMTIECWVYLNTTSGTQTIAAKWASGNTSWLWQFTSSTMTFFFKATSSSFSWSPVANTWYHLAITRSGTDVKFFVNGVQTGSTSTNAGNADSTSIFAIGANNDGPQQYLNGYISNFRIVKGTAITPPSGGPTSPVTAVSGTSLLCNFTNAGILDNTGKNNLETVGNAQIDTGTKKYGTGSMEFDGTGDSLTVPNQNINWEFGSGAFTVEFWTYLSGVSTLQCFMFHGWAGSGALNFGWQCSVNSSGQLFFYANGSRTFTDLVFTANTWHHVAICGDGSGVLSAYLNGTKSSSTPTYTSIVARPSANLCIGGFNDANENLAERQFVNGYIDDLRITKGVARYTAAFTAPTKAFPNL